VTLDTIEPFKNRTTEFKYIYSFRRVPFKTYCNWGAADNGFGPQWRKKFSSTVPTPLPRQGER